MIQKATDHEMESFARQVAICESKASFKTDACARVFAHHRMSRCATKGRPASTTSKLWTYQCPICAEWHLTSQPQAGSPVEPMRATA